MPEEYISREAAVKAANEWVSEACMAPVMRVSRLFDKLAKVPAADVAEVVQGQWYMLDDCANAGLYCSACGRRVHREEFAYKKLRSKYCPHCGAQMDGAAE